MIITPLRPHQVAAESNGAVHRDVYRWMTRVGNALNFWLPPPKTCIMCSLTDDDIATNFDASGLGIEAGPYVGWALANGQNGTDDWTDRFIRIDNTGAGGVGGSDAAEHTHAIDHDHGAVTSSPESGHTHAIDHNHAVFTSELESSHTHTAGSLAAHVHGDASNLYLDFSTLGSNWTSDYRMASGVAASTAYTGAEKVAIDGTTSASSHAHDVNVPNHVATSGVGSAHDHSVDVPALTGVSGASSAGAEANRPSYRNIVMLMRVDLSVG